MHKYGLRLDVTLTNKYPKDPPKVQFIEKIPNHDDIDCLTGEVLRFCLENSCWTEGMTVRTAVLEVLAMVQATDTPEVEIVPPARTMPNDSHRFDLNPREFNHLLKDEDAKNLCNRLKNQTYPGCRLEFNGVGKKASKKDGPKDPHLSFTANHVTASRIKAELDEYLVAHDFRKHRTYFAVEISESGEDFDDPSPSIPESVPLAAAAAALSIGYGLPSMPNYPIGRPDTEIGHTSTWNMQEATLQEYAAICKKQRQHWKSKKRKHQHRLVNRSNLTPNRYSQFIPLILSPISRRNRKKKM